MNNDLIYGKNKTERIVSLEVCDDVLEIFTEDKNGVVSSHYKDNVYWILTNRPYGSFTYYTLEGNLHYKYACTFTDKNKFFKFRNYLKSQQADFYCVNDGKEAIMLRDGYTYFKGMEFKDVSILSFDLETTTLKHKNDSKVLLISNTFRKNGKLEKKLFCYDEYDSQGEMLLDWCQLVRDMNPSIISGHNIMSFDLPYLQYIADQENVQLLLGRDDSPIKFNEYESKFRKDGSQFYHYHKAHIYGRELCDTLFLAIRYDAAERKFESYGLKQIIKQLNLEDPNRVFYDASKIRHNYQIPEEWEKIKTYCINDSDDALKIFDIAGPSTFYATQSIPKSFQSVVESATGSQINSIMVRAYLQDKHSIPKAHDAEHYEGAISIGNPGVYRNVWKVDVASLYPSIILECNVCDSEKDPKEYFLEFMQTFTNERLKNKKLVKSLYDEGLKKYHDDLQAAQKIFINSGYGFLGTSGLNFNSPSKAAFITEKGREILNKAMEWAKRWNFILVNADTDSISITANCFMSEEFRKQQLALLNTNFPDKIKWEDDGYYETVIVLKAKNYVLKEKGKKPKIKGSALKATLKEPRLKDFINEIIIELGIGRNDFQTVYNKYVKEINEITDISKWVTKKTITDKILTNERANEAKVRDALEGKEFSEGDKVFTFFDEDNSIKLLEDFKGTYSKDKLYEKLFATIQIFENVILCDQFLNYRLKRNKKALGELLNG